MEAKRMDTLYRIATQCALIPMFAGISIFALWLITRMDGLKPLGGLVLLVGPGFVAVGLMALAGYYWMGTRQAIVPRRQIRISMLKGIGLLLSNFIVAGIIVAAALVIGSRYTVEIHNATRFPLKDVRVHGAGVDAEVEPIPPGATAMKTVSIKHEGVLMLQAVSGTTLYSKEISGYVSRVHGERHATVRIAADGRITITPGSRQDGI